MSDSVPAHDGFVCTCSPDGRAARDALVADVARRLLGGRFWRPREVTDASFVTDVIGSLAVEYGVRVAGIDWDQWGLIVAEHVSSGAIVRMQCDDVEGGLAAIWVWAADGAVPVE